MSYYATGGGALIIRKKHFEEVVDAYHRWTAKTGYDSNFVRDIQHVFEDQWFEVCFDENGDLNWADFPYEKYRDTGDFIEMLAPWIENGSSIDFTGEEGETWRVSVFNHQFYETGGVVIFPGDPYWEEAEGSR